MSCVRYQRKTAPSATPVSLADAKAHLRVDGTDDDALIGALVDAVTSWLDGSGNGRDGLMGCALVNQEWYAYADGPDGCGRLWLKHGPVSVVAAVETMLTGAYAAWSAPAWRLGYDANNCAFIVPAAGQSWPSRDTREDAVRVTFTAGFGAAGANVPAAIRAAMLLMIGHLYENREAVALTNMTLEAMPLGVRALLAPYRMVDV